MIYIACLDTKCNMDIVKKLCGNVEIEISFLGLNGKFLTQINRVWSKWKLLESFLAAIRGPNENY